MAVTTLMLTVLVVILTSALSGVLGLGGGILLMAWLAAVMPVAEAMVIHGLIQGAANGSRALLLRRHIAWCLLGPFWAGVVTALLLLSIGARVLNFEPQRWLVYVLTGSMVFIPFGSLGRLRPDIGRAWHSFTAGIAVTLVQLGAGVAGPLLDVFFQDTRLNRHEIIATKALTQTIGHAVKSAWYGLMLPGLAPDLGGSVPTGVVLLLVLASVAGTRTGVRLLDGLTEKRFRLFLRQGIRLAGAGCLARGFWLLLA